MVQKQRAAPHGAAAVCSSDSAFQSVASHLCRPLQEFQGVEGYQGITRPRQSFEFSALDKVTVDSTRALLSIQRLPYVIRCIPDFLQALLAEIGRQLLRCSVDERFPVALIGIAKLSRAGGMCYPKAGCTVVSLFFFFPCVFFLLGRNETYKLGKEGRSLLP